MTNIFSSFFQVAGAKSFSDFLKENDKKTCSRKRVRIKDGVPNQKDIEHNKKCEKPLKNKKRRSLRKTLTQRTKRKTSRRTSRKTSRRTKFIKGRTLTKRKLKGVPGKYECVTCNKSVKAYFTGEEPSPKGFGYCARCTPLNVIMKGKDGNLWENKKYSKGKRWIRV